jgi:minor histocompatibility antigen H13
MNTTSSQGDLGLSTGITIAYAAILSMSIIPIYIGSHMSLVFKHTQTGKDEETDNILTYKDAYMFPLVASGFLMGLYILFMLFSKEYINLLLTTYIAVIGIYAVLETFRPVLKMLLPSLDVHHKKINISIPFNIYNKEFDLTIIDVINFCLSIILLFWYLSTKYWIANNILGLCFAIQGVAKIQIGNYKICCILLV